MTRQERALAAKPEYLSSIPGAHVEEGTGSGRLPSDPHMHCGTCFLPTQINIVLKRRDSTPSSVSVFSRGRQRWSPAINHTLVCPLNNSQSLPYMNGLITGHPMECSFMTIVQQESSSTPRSRVLPRSLGLCEMLSA